MNNSRKLTLLLSGLGVICALATILKLLPSVIGISLTLILIGITCLINAYMKQQNKENKNAWLYSFVGLGLIFVGIYIV